jgi:Cu(I)/Ag(I) efflux system membrane fusion protein
MSNAHRIIAFFCITVAGLWITVAQDFSKSALAQHPPGHTGQAQPVAKPDAEAADAKKEPAMEAPKVEISPEQQQLIGVKTATVALMPMSKVIRTVGRIEYDERGLSTINTKFEGWIEKLYIDYTGRYVKKNEPLAEIYSPELLATQQEFLNVLKWSKTPEGESKGDDLSKMIAKDANSLLEAAKQRLKLWDITEAQIQKIEETGAPVRTLTLYSPVSGYIIQKMVVQGMRVMPGEKLFDVADLSTLWVIADVYERELPLIKIGQEARITLSYFPDKAYVSQIDYIYPSLSTETRTAKVRFTISNSNGQLKPQMFTNVEIKIHLGQWLAVPESAVLDTGQGHVAYVDTGDGYFEPRQVTPGLRAERMAQILDGLKAGEKVAVSANFLIDSEAQLKGVKPLQTR